MSLYTITQELVSLVEQIEAGEIPEEAIDDTLEAVTLEWEAKADDLFALIKNLRAEAEAIREEEKALAARRRAKENFEKRLSLALARAMQAVGRTKYESPRHRVTFRQSKALEVLDMDKFVAYARRHAKDTFTVEKVVTLNKDAIKRLLEDDSKRVPGVRIDVRQNIQIK